MDPTTIEYATAAKPEPIKEIAPKQGTATEEYKYPTKRDVLDRQ
jgi:hypothetical protein